MLFVVSQQKHGRGLLCWLASVNMPLWNKVIISHWPIFFLITVYSSDTQKRHLLVSLLAQYICNSSLWLPIIHLCTIQQNLDANVMHCLIFHVLHNFYVQTEFIKLSFYSKDPGYIKPNSGKSATRTSVSMNLSSQILYCIFDNQWVCWITYVGFRTKDN